MKHSEIFRFICRCLALNTHPESVAEVREAFAPGRVEVDRFIHLASNHFVLPAVYFQLKQAKLNDVFPPEYKEHLKKISRLNTTRNQEILGQINELNNAFKKAGIEAIFMKGTANLLDGLYADSGMRMIGDIDLLVQDKDFLEAAKTVIALGYQSALPQYDDVRTLKDYPRMYKADVPADIEIHRVPVHLPFANLFTSELLFQHKKQPGQLSNAFIPAAEHRLIHTFIHSQLGDKGHKLYTPGLRDMYDAFLLMQQIEDLEQVIDQIEEKEKARVFFEYINYLFSPQQDLSQIKNKATLKYIRRHRWFLNHPSWHRLYIRSNKLYELIFIRYIRRIIRALFNKKDLIYIFNRLKDPVWYGKHIQGIREQVFGKK